VENVTINAPALALLVDSGSHETLWKRGEASQHHQRRAQIGVLPDTLVAAGLVMEATVS
jgi:hypothetical protein